MGTFVATGDGNFGSGNELAVIRSIDAGATWADVRPAGHVNSTGNQVATDGAGNWMIGAYQAIWISTDDGVTWTQVTAPVATQNWDYCCAVDVETFLVIRAGGPGTNYVYKTTDMGANWTDVTPDGGAAIKLRNAASDMAGTVVIPNTNGTSTEYRAWVSTDSGDTYTESVWDNGYSNANVISYTGGKFVVGLNAPGIVYSDTGLDGSYTLKSHSGLYTGTTGFYAFLTPYWFGNAEGQQAQTRCTDLAADPDLPGVGEDRQFASLAVGDSTVIAVQWNDQGDPTYSGVYGTTGSINFTTQTPPAAQDGATYYSVAFGGAAPPPAPATRSWLTWF